MRGRFVLAVISSLMFTTGTMVSQTKDLVTVESPDDFSVSPGESKDVEIRITVKAGFRVQANPAANEFLIPLTLELECEEGTLEVDEIRYPEGETYRIKGSEEDLLTYEGTFTLSATIQALDSAEEGVSQAQGQLRYQACDDRVCLPPATLPFAFEIRIHTDPEQ
jgi:hypothetical protein